MSAKLEQIISVGIAILLLAAAAYKLSDLLLFEARLAKLLPGVGILGVRLIGSVLPGLELILGLSLLTGWKREATVTLLPLLVISFTLVSLFLWMTGSNQGCACAKFMENAWWAKGPAKVLLCMLLFAVSLWLYRRSAREEPRA